MDLRLPTGAFFSAVGCILCLTGILLPSAKAPLTDVNVNLYAGAGLLVFGGFFLWLARRNR